MTGKDIRIIRQQQEKEDQIGTVKTITGKTISAKYVARKE